MQEETLGVGTPSSPAAEGIEQAKRVGRSARDQVFSTVDEKKEQLVGYVEQWLDKADAVKSLGIGEGAVGRVRDLTQTVKDRSTRELVGDLEREAHRRPAAFMLGAFAAGFIAARILKDVGGET